MEQERPSLVYKRLIKVRMMAYLLQAVPFLRCLILNGSLAEGRARPDSDIDILIIAADGRIYTVRFLVNLLAIITFQKRSKDEAKNHAGKFCFNYFMTTSYLKIPVGRGGAMDQYCAYNYSHSRLITGNREVFKEFLIENQPLFSLVISGIATPPENYRGARNDLIMRMVARFCELWLSGIFGDWLERRLKNWQVERIEHDARTRRYPDLIVYNDRELRFHPPKSEKDVF